MAGILALQSEVAQKVAGALALKLLPAEQARLTKVKSVDPEVYDFWLKGSEAIQEIERAVAIDLLNTINLSVYAIDLYCVRRYDDAIAQARAVLRMQSDAGVAMTALLFSLHEQKRHGEAIEVAASAHSGPLFGWPDVAEAVRKGYAEAGSAAAFLRAADLETATHGNEPGVAIDAAMNHVMGADDPRALDCLEKAYEQRDPNVPYANCFPVYDPLRAEPRFQALLRKMGLPR